MYSSFKRHFDYYKIGCCYTTQDYSHKSLFPLSGTAHYDFWLITLKTEKYLLLRVVIIIIIIITIILLLLLFYYYYYYYYPHHPHHLSVFMV
jgi:hypothetical protein